MAPLNRKADTVCRVFLNYLVNWAGTPGKIVLDLDTAFTNNFADLTSDHAISFRVIAGQAHWQNVIAERYGALWKACWGKQCVTEGVQDSDYADTITAVNHSWNSLRNWLVFSPRQWVFGSNGYLVPKMLLKKSGPYMLLLLRGVWQESMPFAMVLGTRIIFFENQYPGTAGIGSQEPYR